MGEMVHRYYISRLGLSCFMCRVQAVAMARVPCTGLVALVDVLTNHRYTVEGEGSDTCFEVFKANTETRGLRAYHARMQTFVIWFIDGSSYIDMDDPKWRFYVLYVAFMDHVMLAIAYGSCDLLSDCSCVHL